MLYKPEKYQRRGTIELLENPYYGLLFDPGLGKTATVLHAIKSLRLINKNFRVLVIAPRLVCVDTWPNEIEKWNQFKNLGYVQIRDEKEINFDRPETLWLINPHVTRLAKLFGEIVRQISRKENLPFRDFRHWFSSSYQQKKFRELLKQKSYSWPFDMLVNDESSRFKNSESKRFKILKKFIPYFKRRVILTGTFAPNGLQDVFSQMMILDNGATFGKQITDFRSKYFEIDNPKFYTYKIRGKKEEKEIQKKIAPYVTRLSADEYLNLPKIIFNKLEITLPKNIQKKYDEIEKRLFSEINNEDVLVPNATSKYVMCRQLACGSFYDPKKKEKVKTIKPFHKFKTERLQNLIDELNGKPLLVAYVYRSEMIQIQNDLRKKLPTIGGHTAELNDKKLLKQWNEKKLQILLVQSSSVSHGLNLQKGGNNICFFNITDNLEDYEQLIRRIYRKGVKGQVRIHYLICKNTIDVVNYHRIKIKEEKERDLLSAIERYRKWKRDQYFGV